MLCVMNVNGFIWRYSLSELWGQHLAHQIFQRRHQRRNPQSVISRTARQTKEWRQLRHNGGCFGDKSCRVAIVTGLSATVTTSGITATLTERDHPCLGAIQLSLRQLAIWIFVLVAGMQGSRALCVTTVQKGISYIATRGGNSFVLPYVGQRPCDTVVTWAIRECAAGGPPGSSEWPGATRFWGVHRRGQLSGRLKTARSESRLWGASSLWGHVEWNLPPSGGMNWMMAPKSSRRLSVLL
jgi:hypothetical protein